MSLAKATGLTMNSDDPAQVMAMDDFFKHLATLRDISSSGRSAVYIDASRHDQLAAQLAVATALNRVQGTLLKHTNLSHPDYV